jgi:hypothetical protein
MIHRRICPFLTALIAIPVAASIAQQPASRGTFRTLASFTGELFAADPHVSPDGRIVLLSTQNA